MVSHMTQIISDDNEIGKIIDQLTTTIQSNGGYLHPDITIQCQKKQLSLHTKNGMAINGYAIIIPHACLMPIDEFQWGLDDSDDITIQSASPKVTPLQREITDLVVELFNRTDKITQFRQTCLDLKATRNYKLIETMYSARPMDLEDFKKKQNKNEQEVLLEGLFQTRYYYLFKSPETTIQDRERVIIPIIDLMNHHIKGEITLNSVLQAETANDCPPYLCIKCSPVPGSDECCHNYGVRDAYELFVGYQYIDRNADFLRSVPLTVDLGDTGSMEIFSNITDPGYPRHTLPPELVDLHFFIPPLNVTESGVIQLGYIYIPGQYAPYSMRRVLALSLQQLNSSLSPQQLERKVLMTERQILRKNLDFFYNLKRLVQGTSPCPEDAYFFKLVNELADMLINRIQNYRFFKEAMQE